MVSTIMYILGYLYCLRFTAGYFIDDFSCGRTADMVDIGTGFILGGLVSFMWPPIILGRIVYVLWKKVGPEDTEVFQKLFPPPKDIETRGEKRRRLEIAKQNEIIQHRRDVNRREKELKLPISRWD